MDVLDFESKNSEYFFIKLHGEQQLVSHRRLKELVKNGSFSSENFIWKEETNKWVSAREVEQLNELFDPKISDVDQSERKIYAVASGKGGVGKSTLTASLAVGMASFGKDVILVDANLGGASLHTIMGIKPRYTLFDFYSPRRDTLNDILQQTPVKNLRMISGACGALGIANQKYFQKQRFIRQLKNLSVNSIFLDLGSGASFDVIDFFLLADEKILIVTPEATSILEGFNFIKVSLFRGLMKALENHPEAVEFLSRIEVNRPGSVMFLMSKILNRISQVNSEAAAIFKFVLASYRPKIILNRAKQRNDIQRVIGIRTAAKELLSVNVDYLGYIPFDSKVGKAAEAFQPFLSHNPKSKASRHLLSLIKEKLMDNNNVH